jgi:hypothetical protein
MLTTLSAFRVLLQAYSDVEAASPETDLSQFHRLWKAIMGMKLIFLFGSLTLLCAWSLTSLLCFHGMIISAAQTTNERVRGVYRFGSTENAADKGCCRNWYHAFCTPFIVSRLPEDMSDIVKCQYTEDTCEEMVWAGEAPFTPIDQSAAPTSHGGEALPKPVGAMTPSEDLSESESVSADDNNNNDLV